MQRVRGDDGAVAVIVGIAMVALLGMGTIVIDVGQLYGERRQLQNGADAAVLSIAQDCPTTGCSTDISTGGQAGTKANQNANDGAATITEICGIDATPVPVVTLAPLLPCLPDSDIGPWDCRPPSGPLAVDYVQVRTETRTSGGGNLMPSVLARVLDPSYNGTTVRACARASWGAPSGLTSQLPLTISTCEYQQYTALGFAPPPPYPANYDQEQTLYFHSQTDDAPPCPAGPSGSDLPGGFGWLDTNEDCVATTDTTNWVDASTGAPAPVECSNAELLARRGTIVYIPIFDETNGLNGANGEYHIAGYAAFYLTGYKFPGSKQKSLLTGNFPCGGPDHCISGVFTQALTATAGTIGSGPSMGVDVIQLSG